MRVRWSGPARADLVRLHDFLAPVAPAAANRAVQALVAAAERLVEFPRIGRRIENVGAREVRCIFVGAYELRYEICGTTLLMSASGIRARTADR